MLRKFFFIFLLVVPVFLVSYSLFTAKASDLRVIYISPNGNDKNQGTQKAPFKTFKKALEYADPGDEVILLRGTYNERVNIERSGKKNKPIKIRPAQGHKVTINGSMKQDEVFGISGSYIDLENLELRGSKKICLNVMGNNINIKNMHVHDCTSHGVNISGDNVTFEYSRIYNANLDNVNNKKNHSGSGLKISYGAENVRLYRNTVFNNWGEGIAVTRGKNITVLSNKVYDNLRVNIYVDNSIGVKVDRNFVYCNSQKYKTKGTKASGIAIGEERYDGWGAKLSNINIQNNIVYNCNRSLNAHIPEVSGGGLKNVTITHNTFWGSQDTALSISYMGGKTNNIVISNNIIQQPKYKFAWIAQKSSKVKLHNNFWVGKLPSSATNALGQGDMTGDIKFSRKPGYDPATFTLSSKSPAREKGKYMQGINYDYNGKQRTGKVDMGAMEYK